MKTKIAGILLAAGESKRFGSDKLLYRLKCGDQIGIKAAKKLKQFVDDTKIVLPKENKSREKKFRSLNFDILKNTKDQAELSLSLKTGLSAIQNFDYCIIALADMPFISKDTYSHMIKLLCSKSFDLVAPSFKNRRGHPVGISSTVIEHFLEVNQKVLIKEYFKKAQFSKCIFPTDDPGIICDIDYPKDLNSTLH